MQKLVSSKMRRSILALGFASLLITNVTTLEAKSCDSRTFNIKISEEVATSEILNQLSHECGFSVITKDSVANEKMAEKLFGINIKKMSLEEIFEVLVSAKGLNYSYDNNMLQVSGLATRTFKIDYVNTERTGVSNTDISLTGDTSAEDDSSGAKGGSLSTGATITSNDKFSFWATMDAELSAILNTQSDIHKADKPIINKEAGLVTVTGTADQLNRIGNYIDEMMSRLHKQVLIDVKILSVSLDDSKQTGVNWGEIYKLQNMTLAYESLKTNNVAANLITDGEIGDFGSSNSGSFMRFTGNTQITDLLKFLNTQGNVTSISNPKVVTLSNQPAVFSSGDQLYYKLSSSSRQTGTNAATETYNNEVVKSVFAGILLDITPEITDEGEIILKINPSISAVKSEVATDDSGVRRLPPDLMKKQISSVVKLKDGEKIVLGGLISSRKGNTTYKVPVLGNLPVLGYAFKQNKITEVREELVVIITPHIVNPKRGERRVVSLKALGYEGIK